MTALRAGVTRGRLCARRRAVLRRIVLRPMHEGIVDRIGHQHRTHRHRATGQLLGSGDQIGRLAVNGIQNASSCVGACSAYAAS
ncbi:hypothetical protein [Xanthomonas arboricola]|uniref:hypothetical protein n=1 Tax=Xanthomonas arboricola TaxID=56448 RepID=UPI001AFBB3F5|nr:hypothetical protein [Xanthomonas arboricola]CAD7382547.1 hypothetical protein X12_002620 [Xanthomonas arboricola]CAG2092064.1 hypothetical protein XCY_002624 [Xanthomonas arboricola pv. juglandis]